MKFDFRHAIAFWTVMILILASGCEPSVPTTDEQIEAAQAKVTAEANRQTGLPAISNFTEKKFAKMIYELRDQEIKTWAYYLDVDGNRHLLCESVGYGLPYSTQYSNPLRTVDRWSNYAEQLPQAEPNGLFMPDAADATWVLCSDGRGGVAPVYSEPTLLVSPFPLGHVTAAASSGFADQVQIQRLPPSDSAIGR